LTVLDVCTTGNLKSTLVYFGYIINSMYKSQSTDLKKSKSGQEFNKVLTNSKISVLNFSDQALVFTKKQKSKDVRYPIVKVPTKDV
jgi:hypothetical protein